jgi:hypothetical protein
MKKIPDIEVAKKMINLQQSATSRGIEFDLSFETVKSLLLRTNCFYTGVVFEDEGKLAFSVDRIDSKKGYIEGNVVACTIDINAKKANLTIEEIEQLYKKLIPYFAAQKTPNKPKPNVQKPKPSKQEPKPETHEEALTDCN